MKSDKTYVGIHKDKYGGMTPTGTIIKDAWVFGIIPESESCEGWTVAQLQTLYDQVSKAWGPYGHLASQLPEDLRQTHARIYEASVQKAREQGWSPDMEEDV
jgi:hypothetical protein